MTLWVKKSVFLEFAPFKFADVKVSLGLNFRLFIYLSDTLNGGQKDLMEILVFLEVDCPHLREGLTRSSLPSHRIALVCREQLPGDNVKRKRSIK